MRVEELIEELKKFNQKSDVVCCSESGDIGISIVGVTAPGNDVIIEFRDEEY